MAVRIAAVGKDLFIEWRHYTTPPLGAVHWGYFLAITGVAFVLGLSTLAVEGSGDFCSATMLLGATIGTAIAYGKGHKTSLEGFQAQDSTAFQLAVRAALEEAVNLAGISKTLIQKLSKEEDKERRVI